MPFNSVTIEVDDTDPRDPNAKCDRCGAIGTIARAVRHTADPLVLRYCGDCWPATVQEMEMRQHEEDRQWLEADHAWRAKQGRSPDYDSPFRPAPPPAWTTSSRSWHDTRRFLRLVQQPGKGGPSATPENLAAVAADIRARQSEMDGPIPPDIKEFLDRYTP